MNPDDRERLLDELLQLRFGCHPDPDALVERLNADPQLAELQVEVAHIANGLTRAAREDVPALAVEVPPQRAGRIARRLKMAAIAAVMLALFGPVTLYALLSWRVADLGKTSLGIRLTGPATINAFAPAEYVIAVPTRDEPIEVVARVLDAAGTELHRSAIAGSGNLRTLSVPPLAVTPARLEVTASSGSANGEVVWDLRRAAAPPLVALMTSQPAYRPGDTIRVRAIVLDRLTLAVSSTPIRIGFIDPADASRANRAATLESGIAVDQYALDAHAPAGTWRVVAYDADGIELASTAFPVVTTQSPRLFTTIALDRATYVPGANGRATIEVARASGGAAANATVDVAVFVDGETSSTHKVTLDDEGKAALSFTLPSRVERGEASFVVRVRDGGDVETKAQPFAFALRRLDVRFHPESGALVAGLPTRVYAELTLPSGQQSAASGRIVDDRGDAVATFDADDGGRTRFALTPLLGRSYRMEFDSPQVAAVDLPAMSVDGVVLESTQDSFEPGEPIRVRVRSTAERSFTVALFCRGVLVAHQDVERTTAADVALTPPAEIAGVLRVGVFDSLRAPLAQRLVHRKPAQAVRIALTPERALLGPGERQTLRVRTTDESGAPRSAVLGLSVYDHALADIAGRPRQDLFHQAWLFCDVDDPEHVAALTWAAPADGGSAAAIDRLLGVRGARRFAANGASAVSDDPRAIALARTEALKDGRGGATKVEDTSYAIRNAETAARMRAQTAARGIILSLAVLALLGLVIVGRWIAVPLTAWLPPTKVRFALRLVIGATGPLAAVAAVVLLLTPAYQSSTDSAARSPFSIAASIADEIIDPIQSEGTLLESKAPGATPGSAIGDARREALLPPVPAKHMERGDEAIDDATAEHLRAFAHAHRESATRSDFASLLVWQTALVTDADGNATLEFDTSDRLTRWDVVADGLTDGRVGFGAASFHTGRPLAVEPVLPVELSDGDSIQLPIALRSDDDAVRSALVRVTLGDGLSGSSTVERLDVALTEGGGRAYLPLVATASAARSSLLELDASGGAYADRVQHRVAIAPRGFPFQRAVAGRAGFTRELALVLPSDFDVERCDAKLTLFASPLAELGGALRGILREPHGCFEQTSSANYPNVLALHLLRDLEPTAGDARAAHSATTKLVAMGYERLKSFEVAGGGFEWFGHAPAHEGLTAYGLMQFHDMREVFAVEPALIERTRTWLASRRDGKGGYRREPGSMSTFGGASESTTNAYVTYALATTGDAQDLMLELGVLAQRAQETNDPYELALCAGALAASGRDSPAQAARKRLAEMQRDDGLWTGSAPSMTGSRGENLAVETTAFALLALADDATYRDACARALDALLAFRKADGSFGATQATVMALKAILKARKHGLDARGQGRFELRIDGAYAGSIDVAAPRSEPIVLDGFASMLRSGTQSIEVGAQGDASLPFTLSVEGRVDRPDDAQDAALTLSTALSRTKLEEGGATRLTARVTKLDPSDVGMCLAVIGLPAGLELQTRELERLARSAAVDFAELRGRDLVVYWRSFGAKAERTFHVDLIARIPGTTTGPASRVAPYYQPERRSFAPALTVDIAPLR